MSMTEIKEGVSLDARVDRIYRYLYKLYRVGAFEEKLEGYRYGWLELGNGADFYEYRSPRDGAKVDPQKVSYQEAVEDLYQMILFLESNKKSWAEEHPIQILEIRNLVYEVKDYALRVPPELGHFFIDQARKFGEHVKNNLVVHYADEFRKERSEEKEHNDARAKVIKVLIISALCGVNQLYRLHGQEDYDEALEIIENIEMYVSHGLPHQHQMERQSFGLLGLTMYLKGRLLSAKDGHYGKAHAAYTKSIDAYTTRLDQKAEFYEKGYIDKEDYEEKKTVTQRRAALVSAIGVGYLAFVNSRISEAFAALRGSRVALKQNVGAIYGTFTDILFYACKRAVGSSDKQTIKEVIEGLRGCRETLSKLVPDSQYSHRAGVELAIALHYRAKAEYKPGEQAVEASTYYGEAMRLLNAAIEHSETMVDGHYRNRRMLAEALIVRSHLGRHLPETRSGGKSAAYADAERDARRARNVAKGNDHRECEAEVALGAALCAQAGLVRTENEHEFGQKVADAQESFQRALMLNRGTNARVEGVCHLKLTKLSLFDPSTVALAHDHFKRWQEIESRVEHAYCHEMASELRKQLGQDGPLLVINAETNLDYFYWEKKLLDHLLNTMLVNLSKDTNKENYSETELRGKIVNALIKELNFKKSKAYELVKDKEHNLVERLQRLNK